MKIGLIGAGAIGQYLLKYINGKHHEKMEITSVLVRDFDKYAHLQKEYRVNLYTDINEFIDSEIDIIVEAANVSVAVDLLPKIIKRKEVMLISVGALANQETLKLVGQSDNRTLHLPSGAIGGLDLIQNAKGLGNLDSVSLTTRKPALSLIDELPDKEMIVFEGPASEAIDKYPKNMNVSIVLSLAGLGMEHTKVTLIADPNVDKNIHTIHATGNFGEMELTVKNVPLLENPKTSSLAALSVFSTLERLAEKVKIG